MVGPVHVFQADSDDTVQKFGLWEIAIQTGHSLFIGIVNDKRSFIIHYLGWQSCKRYGVICPRWRRTGTRILTWVGPG